MENYLSVDCCLTCGSTHVYYEKTYDAYMCHTCGYKCSDVGVKHISVRRQQAKKLLAAACCFICLLICIPGTAQNFLPKPRINFDSLVLAAVHRLNVDSIIAVSTPAVNMDSLVLANTPVINIDSIVRANTFVRVMHDTIRVDSNTLAGMITNNFPTLVNRNLYSLGKDTFILNGTDTIKYKPIIWNPNNAGNTIALGAGEVVRLPDLTMFKPSAGYYQTLPIKVDIPNSLRILPSANVIVTGISTKKKTTKKK